MSCCSGPMDSFDSISNTIVIDYWEWIVHFFLSTHDPSQLMQFHQQFAQPTTMALKMGLHHCTPENREVKVRHCATILSLPYMVQQPKPICKHLIYVHTLLTITTKSNLSVLIMSCGQITKKANTRIDTMIILLKVPCR